MDSNILFACKDSVMKTKAHYLITALLICLFPLTALAGEVYFYHTDNFGTPMAMTNMDNEVVWHSDELPFGEEYETIENPIKNNRRYLTKELDKETGLVYMGARFLDPKTGRFNRPDPVGLVNPATGEVNQEMLLDPQRQNRYIYGLNNPYRFVDLDGKFPVLGAALIGAGMAYFSSPDVANAPANSSTPTFESRGDRSIVAGAIGGAGLRGVGSALTATKNVEQTVVRTTRGGDKAVRITKSNGSVIDISPKRVKEFVPNNHPKAPSGAMSRVKFDNAIPKSKGFKRLPTKKELNILGKSK